MIKIAGLLSSVSSQDKASSASYLVEQLTSKWASGGERDPVLRGLVVSEVLKHLTEGNDVKAMVQIWSDSAQDASGELSRILPDRGADAGFQLSAWVIREHVLKEPVERQEPGASAAGVKLAGTAYRRDDFTHEAFFDYWREVHAPISGGVPGLGGYVVSEVMETVSGDWSPDALLELWWPDEATYERSGESPQQAAAWEDVQRYAKTTGSFWLMRERVLLPPPQTGRGLLEIADA